MSPDERAERFHRLMPSGEDLTLIVLKGHLLLEEQLNDFLERVPLRAEALMGARLSFFQKLRVVRAFSIFPTESRAWSLAEELNKLRNKISHHVEVADLDALVDTFIALQPRADRIGDTPPTRAELLRGTIAYAAGMFSALTDVMVEIKQMIAKHAGIQNV